MCVRACMCVFLHNGVSLSAFPLLLLPISFLCTVLAMSFSLPLSSRLSRTSPSPGLALSISLSSLPLHPSHHSHTHTHPRLSSSFLALPSFSPTFRNRGITCFRAFCRRQRALVQSELQQNLWSKHAVTHAVHMVK